MQLGMDISEEEICQSMSEICCTFNWKVTPKQFQQEFFVKAVAGVSGFLEVFVVVVVGGDLFIFKWQAPCGAGKSMLYQLLPFVLKKHR